MDPQPILPSAIDLERRRLENTIDLDLHSLSLGSLHTTTASSNSHSSLPTRPSAGSNRRQAPHEDSFSSLSSLEYPRAFGEGDTGRGPSLVHPDNDLGGPSHHGPHGTPRAAARKTSMMSVRSEMDSPVSTVGHHVSAVTLSAGVFRRGRGDQAYAGDESDRDEFDPERSLGRLVGELGKVMGGRLSPRPTSPFAALSPPRSPSPFSSLQNNQAQNLSLTLNRNDPLPSPPQSRSGSRSSSDSVRLNTKSGPSASRFSSIARELGNDIKTRKALGESQAPNLQHEPSRRPNGKKQDRIKDIREEAGASAGAGAGAGQRRPTSAHARAEGDMTGMTALMGTPAKGGTHDGLDKNGQVGGETGAGIGQHLATIQARLRAVETENAVSRRRVKDLETELERAKAEVESARRQGGEQLREVIGEKTALEDLIKSLRSHLARLTAEVEQNKALIDELRQAQSRPVHRSPPRPTPSVADELIALRKEVERLGNEVHRLGGIVEEGLDTRRRARGERTIRMEQDEAARLVNDLLEEDEMSRIQKDMERRSHAQPQTARQAPPPTPGPSKLRQGLHAAAVDTATLMPPTVAPRARVSRQNPRSQNPTPPTSDEEHVPPTPTNVSTRRRSGALARQEGPASPFPSIRVEDEDDFFEAAKRAQTRQRASAPARAGPSAQQPGFAKNGARKVSSSSESSDRRRSGTEDNLPPQTVLTRVISELEADYKHYKAIYAELADQYKVLDAASAVAKRKVLAEHLKEVIDTLEQKADQIAGLYDILSVKDKPAAGTRPTKVHRTVPDVVRLVRESLGEEGLRRLREDGVGLGR